MAPPSAIDIEGVTDTQAIVLPDPLTINGVSARRTKAGKFAAGTAAFASSDQFKSDVSIFFSSYKSSTDLRRHLESQRQKDGIVSPSHNPTFCTS